MWNPCRSYHRWSRSRGAVSSEAEGQNKQLEHMSQGVEARACRRVSRDKSGAVLLCACLPLYVSGIGLSVRVVRALPIPLSSRLSFVHTPRSSKQAFKNRSLHVTDDLHLEGTLSLHSLHSSTLVCNLSLQQCPTLRMISCRTSS